MTHDIKASPEVFKETNLGLRKFELRKFDREFKVGDTLVIWEYTPEDLELTGRTSVNEIVSIQAVGPGLQPGYCLLGLRGDVDTGPESRVKS